jgi:hypothetical protein
MRQQRGRNANQGGHLLAEVETHLNLRTTPAITLGIAGRVGCIPGLRDRERFRPHLHARVEEQAAKVVVG